MMAASLKLARKAVVFMTKVCMKSIHSKKCGIFPVHIIFVVMNSLALRHRDDSHPLARVGINRKPIFLGFCSLFTNCKLQMD